MGEYLIRNDSKDVHEFDPEIPISHIDANPFGFVRAGTSVEWKWIHPDGRCFQISPEPPGLQIFFEGVSTDDENKIVEYIQTVAEKKTIIIVLKQ